MEAYVFSYRGQYLTDNKRRAPYNPKGLIIYSAASEAQAIFHLRRNHRAYRFVPRGDIFGIRASEYEKKIGPISGKPPGGVPETIKPRDVANQGSQLKLNL